MRLLLPGILALVAGAAAAALPTASHALEPRKITAPLTNSSENSVGRIHVEVPCQADDESFAFSYQLSRPLSTSPASPACASSKHLINQVELPFAWDSLGAGKAIFHIVAQSSLSSRNRTIGLAAETVCLWDAESPHSPPDSGVVEVVSFWIITIDGQLSKSTSGFTVSFDQAQKQISAIVSAQTAITVLPSASTDSSTQVAVKNSTIEKEIQTLGALQEEVRKVYVELEALIEQQRAVIHSFVTNETDNLLKQCQGFHCFFTKLYRRTKDCLHMMYYRYVPIGKADPQTMDYDGQQTSISGYASEKKAQSIAADDDSQDVSRPATHCSSHSDRSHIFVVLEVVACLICVSSLFNCIHARKCNPRARADRAARREERRTMRQYRTLARREAWRTWWNKSIFASTDDRRIQDYEEKRALIRDQEAFLEVAMQGHIQHLTSPQSSSANAQISAAEEGRAFRPSAPTATNASESLPAYRSRTSSGSDRSLPPSYRSYEGSIRSNVSVEVADGFANYTPAETDGTPDGTESLPDSSVPDLSPRHSSETLRTERSLF